jgi:glycosyltransferase involved in cell wall biosynthesis
VDLTEISSSTRVTSLSRQGSEPDPSGPVKDLPVVSIIIPVRNESAHIEHCLQGVFDQDYPTDRLDVIVADGHSEDGTLTLLSKFEAQGRLRVVENTEGIVSTGLNRAIPIARGDIVIRVDGHCEIGRDYVRRCVDHLAEKGVAGVGGSIETVGDGAQARAIARAMSSGFGVGGSAFRTGIRRTRWADTIPFPAYPRRTLELAGPFDEELVRDQDDEYNYRIRALGLRLRLASDVQSRYYGRSSYLALWRQFFQYGFWKIRVFQKHPRQMRPRQFVPGAFVAALCIGAALAPVGLAARSVLIGTVCCYVIAVFAAAAMAAGREEWKLIPLIALASGVMHLAYGFGFWCGIARFWYRWRDRKTRGPGAAWLDTPGWTGERTIRG